MVKGGAFPIYLDALRLAKPKAMVLVVIGDEAEDWKTFVDHAGPQYLAVPDSRPLDVGGRDDHMAQFVG
jgi:hypothetical protein